MFFKTLEIQGFKSFPDKTILTFDRKMTAIVGSNGNGKSNISDALRWVMGEQGAKTLRGDKMEDVIFHGTVARRQMGFAKVALSIDNTDRALGIDADEVVISRKLYRTGESEYLINGAKSRLKDITELLMGTGLGRDGYSIIGQGRVAEIVNAKGTQRREIFEEAAGVSKFLHKKEEAERELARAEDNILRLKDIASGLEERLPILEKQSEKARKAKVLADEEKQLEISVNIHEIDQLDKTMGELSDKVLANQGECEHFDREIAQLEEESGALSLNKQRLTARIENLRRTNDSAKDEIANADKEIAVMENEIVHNEERVKSIERQILHSAESAKEFDEKIRSLNAEIENGQSRIAADKAAIESEKEKLNQSSGENSKLDEKYRELDRRQSQLYGKQTAARLAKQQAESSLTSLGEQLTSATERIENQDGLIAGYRDKRRQLTSQLEQVSAQKQEAENQLNGYTKLFDAKKQKLDSGRTEFENLRRQYEQKKSRYDLLLDVEKNMTGYNTSVKAIIQASKNGKISNVHGTVADIVHMDKKYSVAIEIALGGALQNIIVGNEETAKRAIRYLKETGAGRATFLPLTSVKGFELSMNGLEDEDGFEGLAHKLVTYDMQYDGIVKSILGKTAIVDDIDTATYIAKKYGYRFRIVTLDGQVVNAGGSFTGGSLNKNAGIITRKQEIESMADEISNFADKMEFSKGVYQQLQAEVNKMSIEIEGCKEQLQAVSKEEIRLTTEIAGVKSLIAQCEEQQENAESVIDKHKVNIAKQQAVIDKYAAELSEAENEIAANDKLLADAGEALKRANEIRAQISDRVSQLNYAVLSTEKDIENLKAQIKSVEANKQNLSSGSSALRIEIEELGSKSEQIKQSITDKKKRIEEISGSFKENKNQIAAVVSQQTELEKRSGEINREIREKNEDRQKFASALAVAEERKATCLRDSEKLKGQLWDKYSLAPSEARELAKPIENIGKARADLQEVHRKLVALGSINYASIDEYAEVSERYKQLSEQLSDVEKSKRDLEKLIVNLTSEIKTRFSDSFNEINRHFSRIFKEVFGGGSAHLELTDPEDVLNSGIEIFAAPPGKLVKNLISLSGGEQTMVAITIYFAILLHRPTPFCMLDEVDAALDEVNVVKYVTYLKRFSADTQLMIITHRRGTIEGCDVLYGVFMQEKGVSRLLKQEIIDDLDVELN